MFLVTSSLLLSWNVPELGMWAVTLQIQYKNILEVLTVVSFLPTSYTDHEKSGKSTSFLSTLIY